MKIGLVRRGFSRSGGAEHYLQRFARALVAAGHGTVLFGSPEWPREGPWQPVGDFLPVPGRGPLAFADALERLHPERHCGVLFSLERIHRCDCYRAGDGVHRAWLERRGGASPWRNWLRTAFNAKHRQLLALEEQLLDGGARGVIANSNLVRKEILRLHGTPPERVRVIYNGLHPEAFEPVPLATRFETRARWGLADAETAVLFAGSGWERKGLRYAVEAIGRVAQEHRAVLLVAGAGKLKRPSSPPRTRFLGPVSDMRACYAAADVFVLPTLYDPFSNACLEALAAGLPVITTADNGFSEVLTPVEEGEVIPDGRDAGALARAIAAWCDPVRRMNARPGILAKAAGFRMEDNLARTLAFLEEQAGAR